MELRDTNELPNSPMMTSPLALNIRMTPIERARGRLMRAPDHDAGTGGGDAPAGDAPAADAPAADADPLDGGSILGDAKGDAPADDKGGEGDKADDAAGDKGDDKPGEGEDGKKDDGPAMVGDVPDAYALKAPEGRTLDAEAVKLFEPIFKKLTLTNDGAQELVNAAPAFVDHIAGQVQNNMTAEVVATRKGWAEEAQKDAEIGGANFEQSKAICGRMFDKFGWDEGGAFRTFLNETGLGNHPEMIRAMVKIARATGEDSFERGDSSKGEVPGWDRVYGAPVASQ